MSLTCVDTSPDIKCIETKVKLSPCNTAELLTLFLLASPEAAYKMLDNELRVTYGGLPGFINMLYDPMSPLYHLRGDVVVPLKINLEPQNYTTSIDVRVHNKVSFSEYRITFKRVIYYDELSKKEPFSWHISNISPIFD